MKIFYQTHTQSQWPKITTKTISPIITADLVSNIKPSNIRIWIHERDIGKLTKALWEGHGMRLRTESSNNARVKKFLEAVPYLMVSSFTGLLGTGGVYWWLNHRSTHLYNC